MASDKVGATGSVRAPSSRSELEGEDVIAVEPGRYIRRGDLVAILDRAESAGPHERPRRRLPRAATTGTEQYLAAVLDVLDDVAAGMREVAHQVEQLRLDIAGLDQAPPVAADGPPTPTEDDVPTEPAPAAPAGDGVTFTEPDPGPPPPAPRPPATPAKKAAPKKAGRRTR